MHILYIHQYFATPKGSTGTRSYEFARRWVKAGHKVTLVTGYYDIGGLEPAKGLIRRQSIEGINVIVAGTIYSNKLSYLRRAISFLSFCLFSIYAGLATKEVDVIYATSTPLTVGIPAMILKRLKRVPFVFEVRDQWPEVPMEMGIIRSKVLIKALLWLERRIYKSCSSIIALSPGQADGVRKVLSEDKEIEVIPNSCDTEFFHSDIDSAVIRKEYDWAGKLVFLHAGAMSKVNNLDFVIDAAVRLKEYDNIMFVLMGDGSHKPALESKAKELDLTNVGIFPSVPKQKLPEIYAAVDVGLMIIGEYPILEHNSANKFFDSLSAAKPVLLNYSGWQREVLEENEAGFGCELCNLDEFVKKALYFVEHRNQVLKMGQNARRIAKVEFDRDKLAERALGVISSVTG